MPAQSMTGFGKGESEKFRIEVRSMNQKNLDIQTNIPDYLFSEDLGIRKTVKERFSRGRIEIYVSRQDMMKAKFKVNTSLAKEYYNALSLLKDKLQIAEDIRLEVLTQQRDIFELEEPEIDRQSLYRALEDALEELKNTRIEEGRNLVADVRKRRGLLEEHVASIDARRGDFVNNARQRLQKGLQELLGDVSIDESRLIQETAFLIEKTDITEEIVRFRGHLKYFDEVLQSGDTMGKKLDFIVQELRREINTVSSKVQDFEISNNVVEIKHELEKIKEQAQNLQ